MTVMEEQAPGPADTAAELDERYGRTAGDGRRTRLLWLGTAVVFAVVLVAWLVWGGLMGAPAELQARNAGYEVIAPDEIEVSWNLTVPPGTATTCAVQALNAQFGVVGWKVVDVPASEQRTRTLTELVRTSEQPDSGLIYRCWVN